MNIISLPRIARRYTIQCNLPNIHTVHIELDGGRQAGRQEGGWEKGKREREGGRKGKGEGEGEGRGWGEGGEGRE